MDKKTLKKHLKDILTSFVKLNDLGFNISEKTYMLYVTYGSNYISDLLLNNTLWSCKSFNDLPIAMLHTENEWRNNDYYDRLGIFLYPQTFSYMFYSWYKQYHRKHNNRKRKKEDQLFSFKSYSRKNTLLFFKKVIEDMELNEDDFNPFSWHLFGNVAIKIDIITNSIEYYDLTKNTLFLNDDLFENNQFILSTDLYDNGKFVYNEKKSIVEFYDNGKNKGQLSEYDLYDTIFYSISNQFRPKKRNIKQ